MHLANNEAYLENLFANPVSPDFGDGKQDLGDKGIVQPQFTGREFFVFFVY
jgi:hypothetical protein